MACCSSPSARARCPGVLSAFALAAGSPFEGALGCAPGLLRAPQPELQQTLERQPFGRRFERLEQLQGLVEAAAALEGAGPQRCHLGARWSRF